MLRVERTSNGEVIFTLSGRMDEKSIPDLETLLSSEAPGRPVVLDLKDVTLINDDGVVFLSRCEAEGIALNNCPAYIREWITKQRRVS